jgi:hypothetical protein
MLGTSAAAVEDDVPPDDVPPDDVPTPEGVGELGDD